jgi:hypothetical protein
MSQKPVLALVGLVLLGIPRVSLSQSASAPHDQSPPQNAKLTNRDVLDLVSLGLAPEIVVAKIKSSECAFDTSPSALKQLKAAGMPDSVILAMVTAGSPNTNSDGPSQSLLQNSPTTHTLEDPAKPAASSPKGFKISYVKSEKKWKYGFRSDPYNKISDYLVSKLVDNLNVKGVKTVGNVEDGCCLISVELLEVTSHPALIKKPGIDVSANVSVTDAGNKLIYSKGYRGESRTMANTWGHVINHACEDLGKSIAEDENLVRVLATGKL